MNRILHRALSIAIFMLALSMANACQGQPKVAISTRDGREESFKVEVADSPLKRELGLQYRRDLSVDQGMIFLFPAAAEQSFWMKNTPIPLDMIFISSDRKIVGIVERATPFSLDARSVRGASQYVLEINGGLSQKYGFKPGDPVRFESIPADVRE